MHKKRQQLWHLSIHCKSWSDDYWTNKKTVLDGNFWFHTINCRLSSDEDFLASVLVEKSWAERQRSPFLVSLCSDSHLQHKPAGCLVSALELVRRSRISAAASLHPNEPGEVTGASLMPLWIGFSGCMPLEGGPGTLGHVGGTSADLGAPGSPGNLGFFFHFLRLLIHILGHRGLLEPIPAIKRWEAGSTMDRSPTFSRGNRSHSHLLPGQLRLINSPKKHVFKL